jgi:hypothetical protein
VRTGPAKVGPVRLTADHSTIIDGPYLKSSSSRPIDHAGPAGTALPSRANLASSRPVRISTVGLGPHHQQPARGRSTLPR